MAGKAPCIGHECDQCPRCEAGRCCRKERGYTLPKVGSWQPMFGSIGVRNTDGKRMECHVCGAWFVHVAAHAWQAHDLTAMEYKALFGLTRRGLLGEEARLGQQERSRAQVARGEIVPPPPMTREQRQHRMRPFSPESRTMVVRNHRGRTAIVQGVAPRVALTCQACGSEYQVPPSLASRSKTCSSECGRKHRAAIMERARARRTSEGHERGAEKRRRLWEAKRSA